MLSVRLSGGASARATGVWRKSVWYIRRYRDGYICVVDTHFPLFRRITTTDDSGITTRQILIRDHELMEKTSTERKAD